MGVDISNTDFSDLLTVLGDGDWVIDLPKDYPDLVISASWRQEIIDEIACRFVRWVIGGREFNISHDYDPPWDHSGHAFQRNADPLLLLTRYTTLDEWLEHELTGNSQATFASGCGLSWETFGDELNDDIQEKFFELVKTQLAAFFDDDYFSEEVLDDIDIIQINLEYALREYVRGGMTTAYAWQRYRTTVLEQLEEEQRLAAERAARYEAMNEKVQQFWQQHLADLTGQRIEKPQFRELNLEKRLQELLLDTDPEVVRAIAELGLPGDFSNTVRAAIIEIAHEALTD